MVLKMIISRKQIKKGIMLSVSFSIIALIIVMVLTQNDLAFKGLVRVELKYLFLALLITFLYWLMKTFKLKILTTAMGARISTYKVFSIYLASSFLAHVTPLASGGLPL